MPNIIKIKPNTKEWLKERKKGIGGSDASVVLNVSPWKTPLMLWKEKKETAIEEKTNYYCTLGQLLEPVIRQLHEKDLGMKVNVPDVMFQHPKHKFMYATLDGIANGLPVEYKSAIKAAGWGESGSQDIPMAYMAQCQHNMYVYGHNLILVRVLIGGHEQRSYKIEADKELQQLIIEKEHAFYESLKANNPPLPQQLDLSYMFTKSNGATIEADEGLLKLVGKLKEMAAEEKAVKEKKDALSTSIKLFMGENEILKDEDNTLITWRNSKNTKKFDVDAFSKEHPHLYKEFLVEKSGSRRFLIK